MRSMTPRRHVRRSVRQDGVASWHHILLRHRDLSSGYQDLTARTYVRSLESAYNDNLWLWVGVVEPSHTNLCRVDECAGAEGMQITSYARLPFHFQAYSR